MNPFDAIKHFQCVACAYFRNGKCLCFKTRDGPRARRDCPSCRCVVVTFLLQKKYTQKIFFHLRSKNCSCRTNCEIRNDGGPCRRKASKGKSSETFIFHKVCARNYRQCGHMQALEKNFKDFAELVEKNGKLEIPEDCVPFIGTSQRKFPNFAEMELVLHKKRLEQVVKTKELMKVGNMNHVCLHVRSSSSSSNDRIPPNQEEQKSQKKDFIASNVLSSSETITESPPRVEEAMSPTHISETEIESIDFFGSEEDVTNQDVTNPVAAVRNNKKHYQNAASQTTNDLTLNFSRILHFHYIFFTHKQVNKLRA